MMAFSLASNPEGVIDYLKDPTGMGAYRQGLAQQEAAQRAELEAARGRAAGIGKEFTDTGEFIANTYSPYANLASLGAQGMTQDYSVTPQAYQFQGQVSDYLDPSIAYQQDQARRQLESSAAARGNLMSGAAAKAIADRAQQIGAQGYNNAYAAMERDRGYGANQAQQNYMNQVAQGQQQYTQAQNVAQLGLQGLSGQGGALQQGVASSAAARLPTYTQQIDPTAGLGTMQAGQMRGGFTQGLFSGLGNAVAPGLQDLVGGIGQK